LIAEHPEGAIFAGVEFGNDDASADSGGVTEPAGEGGIVLMGPVAGLKMKPLVKKLRVIMGPLATKAPRVPWS